MKKLFLILAVMFIGVVSLNVLNISPINSAYAAESSQNLTYVGPVNLVAAMNGVQDCTAYLYSYKSGGVNHYTICSRKGDLTGWNISWGNHTFNGRKYRGYVKVSGIPYYFN